jgi:hypothetical protein
MAMQTLKQEEHVKLRSRLRKGYATIGALGSLAYKNLHHLLTTATNNQCPGPAKLSIWHRLPPTPNKSPLNLSGTAFIAARGREDGYRRSTQLAQHQKKEPVWRSSASAPPRAPTEASLAETFYCSIINIEFRHDEGISITARSLFEVH